MSGHRILTMLGFETLTSSIARDIVRSAPRRKQKSVINYKFTCISRSHLSSQQQQVSQSKEAQMNHRISIGVAIRNAAQRFSTSFLALTVALVCMAGWHSAYAIILAPGDDKIHIFEEDFDSTQVVTKTRTFSVDLGSGQTAEGHITDRVLRLDTGFLGFETRIFVDSAPEVSSSTRRAAAPLLISSRTSDPSRIKVAPSRRTPHRARSSAAPISNSISPAIRCRSTRKARASSSF